MYRWQIQIRHEKKKKSFHRLRNDDDELNKMQTGEKQMREEKRRCEKIPWHTFHLFFNSLERSTKRKQKFRLRKWSKLFARFLTPRAKMECWEILFLNCNELFTFNPKLSWAFKLLMENSFKLSGKSSHYVKLWKFRENSAKFFTFHWWIEKRAFFFPSHRMSTCEFTNVNRERLFLSFSHPGKDEKHKHDFQR